MRRLIVIGPLPPPYHGVSISTSLVLASPLLSREFDVEHVDTSDNRTSANIGRWEVRNVWLGLRSAWELLRRTRGPKGIVYLPASANVPAFLRDSLYVHVAALRGWKVVAHMRGSDFRELLYERQGPVIKWWMRVTLRRLASMAVMGESLRWLFDGLIAPERVAVIPNGTPDPGVDGGGHDGEVGLYLSNLRRRKGVVQSVEAALLVLEERPSAEFRFVGGWESPELERELRERASAAAGRIRFEPVVTGDAKRETLAAADYLLFPPAEPEGHPRVILEAQAAGLPVITTDRGAIAETVVDGETGYVLPDPEPRELADRILDLLRDPERRRRMARAARARHLEHFTQEAADRRLTEWLRGVADG